MLGRASGMAMYRSNILRVSSGLWIPNLVILIATLGSLEVGDWSGCRIRRVRIMPMILGSLLYLGRAGVEDSPVTRASGSKYIVITATLSWEGSGQDVPFSSLGGGRDRTLGVPVFGAVSYIRSSKALALVASSTVFV